MPKYGLNQTEIKDFLEYWLDRLPEYDSPYFAIKPMLNDELDEICPIQITPNPDKILRLWFSFTPVNNKIEIEKPHISFFERTGFVAVEWGGFVLE